MVVTPPDAWEPTSGFTEKKTGTPTAEPSLQPLELFLKKYVNFLLTLPYELLKMNAQKIN